MSPEWYWYYILITLAIAVAALTLVYEAYINRKSTSRISTIFSVVSICIMAAIIYFMWFIIIPIT